MRISLKFTKANRATLELFGATSEAEFTPLGPLNISPEFQPDGSLSSEKAWEMIEIALREGSHLFEWEHLRLDERRQVRRARLVGEFAGIDFLGHGHGNLERDFVNAFQ